MCAHDATTVTSSGADVNVPTNMSEAVDAVTPSDSSASSRPALLFTVTIALSRSRLSPAVNAPNVIVSFLFGSDPTALHTPR